LLALSFYALFDCSVRARNNCYLSPRQTLFRLFSLDFPATMKSAPVLVRALAVMAILPVAGCASIISGRHAEVTINSFPSDAHVVVRDKRGREVANAITPATVALKRKDKFIFPARYTATIEAPGYQPVCVPIGSTVNPWILGNIVIGGIPGLIVDNATGAVWMPTASEIDQQLTPLQTAQRTPRARQIRDPAALQTGYDEDVPSEN
jgi:hypothetical protein